MPEEIKALELVEKFFRDEMTAEEQQSFHAQRAADAAFDQMVVTHLMFLSNLEQYSDRKNIQSNLQSVHDQLLQQGEITAPTGPGKVIELWRKYKRVMSVAASIAGITTLLIASMVSYYSRMANRSELEQLRREFKIEVANKKKEVLNEVDKKIKISKAPENVAPKSGGTGFLIDGKGYLVTNAHVVNNASSVIVLNNKGDEFRAIILHVNEEADLAFLKIEDEDFKTFTKIPYAIKKDHTDLGEPLFTLGYPRNEIVYNEGYMSAKTGFNGDTMTCQIGVPANPGNSGGPVFNKKGEIIGIINTRMVEDEGVVFAVTSKNIFKTLDQIKKEEPESIKNLKLPLSSSLKKMDRSQQVKRIQDCVFMVKTY